MVILSTLDSITSEQYLKIDLTCKLRAGEGVDSWLKLTDFKGKAATS